MTDTTDDLPPIEPDHSRQKQIDQMTLELLVNKSQYRKYLEKTDPTEYTRKQERYDRFAQYRSRIGRMFDDLLNDYSVSGSSPHLGNTDIQELFSAFVDKSVYYFETREFDQSSGAGAEEHDDDDDVMFGNMSNREPSRVIRENAATYSAPFANHYRPGNSFWGKNIDKVPRR
jgi:hypothetical protein